MVSDCRVWIREEDLYWLSKALPEKRMTEADRFGEGLASWKKVAVSFWSV
jgi:hypothetical protein